MLVLVCQEVLQEKTRAGSGGVRNLFWKACPISRVDHPEGPPTPQTSFQCPHPDKKGTNLLLFKFCIHLHTHQDLKLKCCRVMGQKLRYGRPCTQYLPGTHNWLAQSHIASISSKFHYLMLAQSCEFGVNCCSIGLTHPAACTRARERASIWLLDMSTAPPLNPICSKKVPIDWA